MQPAAPTILHEGFQWSARVFKALPTIATSDCLQGWLLSRPMVVGKALGQTA